MQATEEEEGASQRQEENEGEKGKGGKGDGKSGKGKQKAAASSSERRMAGCICLQRNGAEQVAVQCFDSGLGSTAPFSCTGLSASADCSPLESSEGLVALQRQEDGNAQQALEAMHRAQSRCLSPPNSLSLGLLRPLSFGLRRLRVATVATCDSLIWAS